MFLNRGKLVLTLGLDLILINWYQSDTVSRQSYCSRVLFIGDDFGIGLSGMGSNINNI